MTNYILRDYSKLIEEENRVIHDGNFINVSKGWELQSNQSFSGVVYIDIIDDETNKIETIVINNYLSPECTFISKIENSTMYFSSGVKIIDIKIGNQDLSKSSVYIPFDLNTETEIFFNLNDFNNYWWFISKQYPNEDYNNQLNLFDSYIFTSSLINDGSTSTKNEDLLNSESLLNSYSHTESILLIGSQRVTDNLNQVNIISDYIIENYKLYTNNILTSLIVEDELNVVSSSNAIDGDNSTYCELNPGTEVLASMSIDLGTQINNVEKIKIKYWTIVNPFINTEVYVYSDDSTSWEEVYNDVLESGGAGYLEISGLNSIVDISKIKFVSKLLLYIYEYEFYYN